MSGSPFAVVTMSDGDQICLVGDYEWRHLDIEDARLISAAPDLFAVLKQAVDWLNHPNWANALADLLESAGQAAIDKAEGRS